MESDLEKMHLVLNESTTILCQFLDLNAILIPLKSKSVLNETDVYNIRAKTTKADQIDAFLDVLRRRPAADYEKFMKVLNKTQQDLHEKIVAIEIKCGYDRKGKACN